MSKRGQFETLWKIQHEVVCVPGQQWQHTDIWHRSCCPDVRSWHFTNPGWRTVPVIIRSPWPVLHLPPLFQRSGTKKCHPSQIQDCYSTSGSCCQWRGMYGCRETCLQLQCRHCKFTHIICVLFYYLPHYRAHFCWCSFWHWHSPVFLFRKPTPYSCSTKRWSGLTGIQPSPK